MSKAKKINLIIILTLIIALLAVSLSLGAFSAKNDLGGSITTGEIKLAITTDVIDSETANLKKPGDKYSRTITVSNSGILGDAIFLYSLAFNLTNNTNSIDQAILVYIDGNFLGTLNNVKTQPYSVKTPLNIASTRQHIITLEYHIGAGDRYNAGTFTLEIAANAVQKVGYESLFISNDNELKQAIALAEQRPNLGVKTLILANNIELTNNVNFTKPLDIDLNGFVINFNGFSMSYTASGIATIYDNSNGAKGKLTDSKKADSFANLNINTAEGLLLLNVQFDAKIIIGISNYSKALLETSYYNYLNVLLSKEIITQELDAQSFYKMYLEKLTSQEFHITTSNSAITFNTNGKFIITPNERTTPVYVTINLVTSKLIRTSVRGSSGEAMAKAIFLQELGIKNEADEILINSDIFLATRSSTIDASLEWISSDNNILSSDGIYNQPYQNTKLALTAIVTINNKNYIVSHANITAISKTPEQKLREICLKSSLKYVSIGEVLNLPTLTEYQFMGLTNIQFDISEFASLFTLKTLTDATTLTLNVDTDITVAKLKVIATFDGVDYENYIKIEINILRNSSIFDAVFPYVASYFSHIGKNTLQSFELPGYYIDAKTVVTYQIIDTSATVKEYLSIVPRPEMLEDTNIPKKFGVEINTFKLPRENTEITIRATATYSGGVTNISQERDYKFFVSGVLHYEVGDVEDFNLFQTLCKVYNANDNFVYITRDIIDSRELTALNINDMFIKTIAGLRFFKNISTLNLSNNQIADIRDLEELTALRKLDLSGNNIKITTSLRNLTNLTHLRLSNNFVEDLSTLTYLRNIQMLNLEYNISLSNLQVLPQLSKLRKLTFYNTAVSTIAETTADNMNYLLSAYNKAKIQFPTEVEFYKDNATTKWIPDNNLLFANNILNNIAPIYEISNVIHLPFELYYIENNERILLTGENFTWSEAPGTNVVTIDNINKTAYINTPVADTDIYLIAKITFKSLTLTKRFKVLSRSGNVTPYIETPTLDLIDATLGVPDPTLRYKLFQRFDANADNTITQAEIARFSGDNINFDLNNLGIYSIKGLELFGAGIKSISLRGNNFTDITPINSLSLLEKCYLDSNEFDFTSIIDLINLKELHVYGCSGLEKLTALTALYNIFAKQGAGFVIYKDSAKDTWNPYIEEMQRALSKQDSIHILKFGEQKTLSTAINGIKPYGGAEINCNLTYQYTNVKSNDQEHLEAYHLDVNLLSYAYSMARARDSFGAMRITMTHPNSKTTVTTIVTIVSEAPNDMLVTTPSGYKPLIEAIPNYEARSSILRLYKGETVSPTDSRRVISKTTLDFVKSIIFDGAFGELIGVELLTGLTSLEIVGYDGYSTSSLQKINNSKGGTHPNLRTLTITSSYVNIAHLSNLNLLTTLTINNCTTIVMSNEKGESNWTALSNNLNALYLQDNNITSFKALSVLKVQTLYLYNNPASVNTTENNQTLLEIFKKHTKDPIDYRVVSANILWASTEVDWDAVIKVDLKSSIFDANYITSTTPTISLPSTLSLGTDIYPIIWESSSTAMIVSTTGGITINNANISKAPYLYSLLTASIIDLAIKKEYQCIIKGTGSKSDAYLDITDFMIDGKLADPEFAYYMLYERYNSYGVKAKSDLDSDGLLSKLEIEDITSAYFETNATSKRFFSINDIRGIKNFTSLQSIAFTDCSVKDISELYGLTSLYLINIANTLVEYLTVQEGANAGKSIFENLEKLTSLYVNGSHIIDFSPIYYRKSGNDEYNIKCAQTMTYLNIDNTKESLASNLSKYLYIEEVQNFYSTILNWLKAAKLKEPGVLSYILRINTVDIRTKDGVNKLALLEPYIEAIVDYNKANEVIDITFNTDNALPTVFNGYKINWSSYGDGVKITVSDSGNINSSSTEAAINSRELMFIAEIDFDNVTGGLKVFLAKLVRVRYVKNNQVDFKIEVTKNEYESVYSEYKIERAVGDTKWYIDAKKAIPDDALRSLLFANFNEGGATGDSVISISERAKSLSTLNAASRNIVDITGIELFYNIGAWDFSYNNIVSLPPLALPMRYKNATAFFINLAGNNFLKDLSNIDVDKDGAGTIYTSLANAVNSLYLNNCAKIGNDVINDLAKLTAIAELRFNVTKITNLDFLPSLYKTLSLLPLINTNNIIFNNNTDYIHKFILDGWLLDVPKSITGGLKLDEEWAWRLANMPRKIISDMIYSSPFAILSKEESMSRNRLPQTYNTYGSTYYLEWELGKDKDAQGNELGNYEIFLSDDGSYYYIVVSDNAPGSLSVKVNSRYYIDANGNKVAKGTSGAVKKGSYYENVTLRTSNLGSAIVESYNKTGTEIQLTQGGAWEDIKIHIPDVFLRYYLMASLDTNNDNKLSYEELDCARTPINGILNCGSKLDFIRNIKGLEHLRGLTDLSFGYSYITDFNPIKDLTSLVKLRIEFNKLPLVDFKFLNKLVNLKEINLHNTSYESLNFLLELPNLNKLSMFNLGSFYKEGNTSSTRYANFVANALAYARLFYNLPQEGTDITADNPKDFVSTEDAKIASLILGQIVDNLVEGQKTEIVKGTTNLTAKVSYKGEDYAIKYISLCSDLVFGADGSLTLTPNIYRQRATFVASIEYNGKLYQRFFYINNEVTNA